MRRLVPLVLAVALVAIAAVVILPLVLGGGDGAAEAAGPAVVSAPTVTAASEAIDDVPDVLVPTPGQDLASATAPEERRTVETAADVPERAGAAVRVQVVRRYEGEGEGEDTPLAGARVLFAADDVVDAAEETPEGKDQPRDELLARIGAAKSTDDTGEVWLPMPADDELRVVCLHEGLYGETWIDADEAKDPDGVVLRLVVDRTVRITVVDAAGQPRAGVPVAVVGYRSTWHHRMWDGVTAGEDGVAVVRHAQRRLGSSSSWNRFAATLGFPVESPPSETLDLSDATLVEARLELPVVGGVAVEVIGLDGEPYEGEVSLTWREHVPGDSFFVTDRPFEFEVEFDGPRTTMPHVGVGMQLSFEATADPLWRPAEWAGTGPTSTRDVLSVVLVFERQWPVLAGRIVDAEGEPLVERKFQAVLDVRGEMMWSNDWDQIETDAAGRFQYVVEQGGTGDAKLELELSLRDPDEGESELRARIDETLPLAEGIKELGDVALLSSPLVASGVVLEPDGSPSKGGEVKLAVEQHWGDPEDGGGSYWEQVWDHDTDVGEDGTFEVRGIVDSAKIQLHAERDGFIQSAPIEVAHGATGVRLELKSAGSISGTVELDERVNARLLAAVALRPPSNRADPDAKETVATERHLDAAGAFSLNELEPGTYAVEFRIRGEDEALGRVEGVDVRAGEKNRDPRLDGYDLRGQLTVVRLTVVDDDGNPVPRGHVLVLPDDPEAKRKRGATILHGSAQVLIGGAKADLELHADGHRTTIAEAVRSDREVVMRGAIPVVLRLPAEVELPDEPRHLMAFLVLEGAPEQHFGSLQVYDENGEQDWRAGMPALWSGQPKEFNEGVRELHQTVELPGTYLVQFHVMTRTESMASTSQVNGGDGPHKIEVLDLPRGQEFTIAPDPEAWKKELAKGAGI